MRRAPVRLLTGLLCAATGVATLGATAAAAAAASATPAAATPVSFTTPGTTAWTVPAGVHALHVVAVGAKGGDSPAGSAFHASGGAGSSVSATLDVVPGEQLHVVVDSGGGASQWGGAGGGAADVRVAPFALDNRVVVAAGGGGAGADSSECGTPGAGGVAAGGNGADGPAQHQECSPGGSGGTGASATAPGTGGDAFYVTTHHSGDGAFGAGGVASGDDPTDAVGGGGGGGWFGGGAGGGLFQSFAGSGGGGGAGSDHVAAPAHDAVVANGAGTGTASVTITPIATSAVSITSSYSEGEARLLLAVAYVGHRSEATVQHDATLTLVRLLDRAARHAPARVPFGAAWAHDRVHVTSTYTAAQAAAIGRVASRLRTDPPHVQRLAVDLLLFFALLHR